MFFQSLILASLSIGAFAAQGALPDKFELYGYGAKFGGLPVVFAGGHAFIGDVTQANSTDAAEVTFTKGSNDVLSGAPSNVTNGESPSWSDVLLTIPASDSTDKRMTFTTGTNGSANSMTAGFVFYGVTCMHKDDAGQLESAFTALPVNSRVSALYWNDTSLGQVPVVLRAKQPSNPSS